MFNNFLWLVIILLLFSHCNNKSKRIEIENNKKETQTSINITNKSIAGLTPETFFKITIEINQISKKYKQIRHDDTEKIQENLKKMEQEIEAVYNKYKITADQFNKYGESHYKKLEEYLKNHPEVDESLRSKE